MKEQINVEEAFEQLKSIKAPNGNFLSYQQLLNTIERVQQEKAPKSLLASCIISLLLVLACNFWTIEKETSSKEPNLVEEMGLFNNLSIYG